MTLNDYLERYGIKQAAFAKRVGVSQAAICRYCNGRRPASAQIDAIMIATGGAVSANDFVPDDVHKGAAGMGFGMPRESYAQERATCTV
jgi:DNA-binding transcriptional regulator YdaS (Cro superfamily)